MPKYTAIGLGGTFDHFHLGHQQFLKTASQLAQQLYVGVTVPELSQQKVAAHLIQDFPQRLDQLRCFLLENHISAVVFALSDAYGPTLANSPVQAVAVTEHTRSGGERINQRRAELDLPALPVHLCPLVRDQSGEFLSSTRIRLGEVSRDGVVFAPLLTPGQHLPPHITQRFQLPQGPVVTTARALSAAPIFLVGDIVTETFIQNHWPFTAAFFDQRNQRQSYLSSALANHPGFADAVCLPNPAGQLSSELVAWLQAFCHRVGEQPHQATRLVRIEGEEDLVTVAAVLLAPLGTQIYYGQPQQGMVELVVTEELKARFARLLRPTDATAAAESPH